MTLMETGSAARVLGLSLSRVRQLAECGELRVAFVTRQGRRLFDSREVARVQRTRERRFRRRGAGLADTRRKAPG